MIIKLSDDNVELKKNADLGKRNKKFFKDKFLTLMMKLQKIKIKYAIC